MKAAESIETFKKWIAEIEESNERLRKKFEAVQKEFLQKNSRKEMLELIANEYAAEERDGFKAHFYYDDLAEEANELEKKYNQELHNYYKKSQYNNYLINKLKEIIKIY
ncbi:hypothetical protein J7E26_08930 [Bacillus sp. ISL-51]|uniref:hypothetical protein n=1 Tax=unclassified Bacillus (in: firmicutes) TaxID=185979 RepID=UPI001BE815EF|nr:MULTISPECIES: hypothetical protein [unclassified Bacillus (in: firmicutes)]MBT2574076.1 hypothetical protein [Bacillus sp. ISL-51]MBT2636028.1 hypothetical protein [Bacillus sp. ISL-26]MBY8913134.1 hypothetical protein [Bacillus sp. YC2]